MVGFVTSGIRCGERERERERERGERETMLYRLQTDSEKEKENMKEEGEMCVRYLLTITYEADSDLSWLLAHIM